MATSVRISEATRDRLRAHGHGRTADDVINDALDQLDRRRFWDQYAAAARADQKSAEELAEEQAWDSTLSDGLE